MIQAGIGRFGPFLKHEGKFTSLPKGDDVMHVGMNRAVEVLAQAAEKRAAKEAAKAAKDAEKEQKETVKKKPKKKKTTKKSSSKPKKSA